MGWLRLFKRKIVMPHRMKPEDFILTKENEGYRNKPYRCTADKLTIGWGRNLDDRGISVDEAELMFKNDIYSAIRDLMSIFPNLPDMTKNQRVVLVDMMFNLGYNRFKGFKKFIEAIRQNDWETVKLEMKDSVWFQQVGNRGKKLLELLG